MILPSSKKYRHSALHHRAPKTKEVHHFYFYLCVYFIYHLTEYYFTQEHCLVVNQLMAQGQMRQEGREVDEEGWSHHCYATVWGCLHKAIHHLRDVFTSK